MVRRVFVKVGDPEVQERGDPATVHVLLDIIS